MMSESSVFVLVAATNEERTSVAVIKYAQQIFLKHTT